MTVEDIHPINLVQAICLRPRMYTDNGTLAEIYSLLSDDSGRQPIAGSRNDESVTATIQWLHSMVNSPDRLVEELIEKYGSDEEVLKAMYQFAETLPPN